MVDEGVTKTDIAQVEHKVDAVATTLEDVQHKTKQLQKSADIKAEDWDLLTDIKGEVIKTQAKITELVSYLDQFRRDIKEEIGVSEKAITDHIDDLLAKKAVVKFRPLSWWQGILNKFKNIH